MAGKVGVVNGSLVRVISDGTSGYWKEYALYPQAFKIKGGEPTPVDANANSLGGYQLNNDGEILAFNTHVDNEWDEISDIVIDVYFDIQDAGEDVADTVDFDLTAFIKGQGDVATKSQDITASVIVGTAAQYTQFEAEAVIDYNDGANPVSKGDSITIEINLNTTTSEIDDIVLSYVEIKYHSLVPSLER